MTPNLFIMSSGYPGKPVAEALAQLVAQDRGIDVDLWSAPEVFQSGEGFLDGLMRALLVYDFGLSILTPDDQLKKKGADVLAARDNVLFESGLFLGSRGKNNAILLRISFAGERPDLPTDLKGHKTELLELPFEREDATITREKVLACQSTHDCAAILRSLIERRYQVPQFSILPSSGLAIGYFYNFVLPVVSSLLARQSIELWSAPKKKEILPIQSFRLVIYIPESIDLATRERWARRANDLKLEEGVVDIPKGMELPRSYPFRLQVDRSSAAVCIYDLPTTLYSTKHIVRDLLEKSPFTEGRYFEQAIEREKHNFVNALRYLLERPQHDQYKDLIRFETLPAV